MHFVTRKQMAAAKVDDFTVVTEASQIGLPVGQWPDFLVVVEDDTIIYDNDNAATINAKGGFWFLRDSKPQRRDGELLSFDYHLSNSNFKIVVLND